MIECMDLKSRLGLAKMSENERFEKWGCHRLRQRTNEWLIRQETWIDNWTSGSERMRSLQGHNWIPRMFTNWNRHTVLVGRKLGWISSKSFGDLSHYTSRRQCRLWWSHCDQISLSCSEMCRSHWKRQWWRRSRGRTRRCMVESEIWRRACRG